MNNPKRIFQYETPAGELAKDRTRWIAADDEAKADRYAQRKGWRRAGGACGSIRPRLWRAPSGWPWARHKAKRRARGSPGPSR